MIVKEKLTFPLRMWLMSRGLIFLVMLGIAPLLPEPSGGIQAEFSWNVFSAWDSEHYRQIVTSGYQYSDNQAGANLAFFPLFPLLVKLGTSFGLSFDQAGTLLSNLAFLGALILLYDWMSKFYNTNEAKWITAIVAWCPFSLFGTVIYTEGLFLLFSIGALRAFELEKYPQSCIFTALATATRVTGLALIPAFMIVAWRKKLPWQVYVSSLAGSLGVISYSLFCWLKTGNPIAFITVQKTHWIAQQDYWGQGWLKIIAQISVGYANWKEKAIVDPWYPLIVITIIALGYLLWQKRGKWGKAKSDYGLIFLGIVFWLVAGNPFLNAMMVFGGMYLLWQQRHRLSLLMISYGWLSYALIFSSGRTASAERYVYAMISVAIAFGLLISNKPRWKYAIISFFGLLLILFSLRFAQHLWVA